jgi:carboxypeptidase Q
MNSRQNRAHPGFGPRARVGTPLAMALAAALGLPARPATAEEPVDLGAIHQIKQEGMRRSKVMDYASMLTDVHGPRLTGSPGIRAAGEWARKAMAEAGLQNAHLETWGPFGRGWSQEYFEAHVTSPQRFTLVGFPKAWTPGTAGRVKGDVVMVSQLAREEDLKAWEGKLKGKFVFFVAPRPAPPPFTAAARRLTEEELKDLAFESDPARQGPRLPGMGGGGAGEGGGEGNQPPQAPQLPLYMSPREGGGNAGNQPDGEGDQRRRFVQQRMKFLIDQGVLAVLEPGRGDSGVFVVSSGGPRDRKEAQVLPQVVLTMDHYNRIARLLAKKIPVTIEMDVRNRFHDDDPMSFNVIADVPGTDKKAELVMLGAHLDSWHSGTGATDNAVGVAIVMEAARILKATGLKLRRTVRVGLWTGEEQGLHGSRHYVKGHFADPADMKPKPEHARLSAYYNLDNGTGAIRGIFAQSNDAVVPIFEDWCAPLRSLGVTTVSPRNTGSTDHIPFDAVGLPGFQFIQDPVDYQSRTHHTNLDTYERLVANDMMKNAVVMASFAYHTANRGALLPRKPMPKAPERRTQPAGRQPTAQPASPTAPRAEAAPRPTTPTAGL